MQTILSDMQTVIITHTLNDKISSIPNHFDEYIDK